MLKSIVKYIFILMPVFVPINAILLRHAKSFDFAGDSLKVSPNGRHLAMIDKRSRIVILKIKDKGLSLSDRSTVSLGTSKSYSLAFSPDGQFLAFSCNTLVTMFLVNDDGLLTQTDFTFTLPSLDLSSTVFSPDGKHLAITYKNSNEVTLLHVTRNAELSKVSNYTFSAFPDGKHDATFSPNGELLAIANEKSNNITILEVNQDGTLSETYKSPFALPEPSNNPVSIAFSPDGKHIVTANKSGDVSFFKVTEDGLLIDAIPCAEPFLSKGLSAIVFSPDSQHIVAVNTESDDVTTWGLPIYGYHPLDCGNGATTYGLSSNSIKPTSIVFAQNGDETLLITSNLNDMTVFVVSGLSQELSRNEFFWNKWLRPPGVILGTTLGVPATLVLLMVGTGIASFLIHRILRTTPV